jgi:ABC-type nitrate/sulfonate/bicarbonate transport system substrate-binding protein
LIRSSLTKIVVVAAAAIAVTIGVAACGSSSSSSTSGSSGSPTPISFRLSFLAGGDAAPFVVADQKGFYTKNGVDVSIKEASDATSTSKLVATGNDQMGYIYGPPEVLLAGSHGLPITSVYSFYQSDPFGILSLKSSGITSPTDLAGKKVGLTGAPFEQAEFNTMLNTAGVSTDSVDVVNVGFNGLQATRSGQLNANSDLSVNANYLGKKGTPVNFFTFAKYGAPDYPFESIIANNNFLQDNPDAVKGFNTGTSEGILWAKAHPQEAADMVMKAYPNNDPKQVLYEISSPQGWNDLSFSSLTDEHGLGYQDPAVWSEVAKFLDKNNLIDKPINPTAFYTNDDIDSNLK